MSANLSRLKCLLCQSRMAKFHNYASRGIAAQTCTTVEKNDDSKTEDKIMRDTAEAEAEDLVEPTTCCMSGCANCVWIEYAKKLNKSMENSSEDLQKLIMDKVQDPNMRAFLSFELRCRKLIH